MRVTRVFIGFVVVVGMVASAVTSSFAGSTKTTPATRALSVSYLALGDSMAVGYQPGKGATTGYVGRVWRSMRHETPGLSLQNVGCAGETSRSMITGKHSPCQYAAGSQLNAGVVFLQAHQGEVSFITIDIGSNDLIDRCLDPNTLLIDRACAAGLRPLLEGRLTRILDTLGAAAPGVPIVGMTYDDPFLGLWGLVPGGHSLARADQRAWGELNAGLAQAYGDAGAAVADVAATFRTDDFTRAGGMRGRSLLPVNVRLVCEWTWFCSTRFTGDPHPDRMGYAKVASTFHRELQGLLP